MERMEGERGREGGMEGRGRERGREEREGTEGRGRGGRERREEGEGGREGREGPSLPPALPPSSLGPHPPFLAPSLPPTLPKLGFPPSIQPSLTASYTFKTLQCTVDPLNLVGLRGGTDRQRALQLYIVDNIPGVIPTPELESNDDSDSDSGVGIEVGIICSSFWWSRNRSRNRGDWNRSRNRGDWNRSLNRNQMTIPHMSQVSSSFTPNSPFLG